LLLLVLLCTYVVLLLCKHMPFAAAAAAAAGLLAGIDPSFCFQLCLTKQTPCVHIDTRQVLRAAGA
jgi:uncharacterized protein (DUF2062 family)